jgi:hypothetical protein
MIAFLTDQREATLEGMPLLLFQHRRRRGEVVLRDACTVQQGRPGKRGPDSLASGALGCKLPAFITIDKTLLFSVRVYED